jgi:hypothetical protein
VALTQQQQYLLLLEDGCGKAEIKAYIGVME